MLQDGPHSYQYHLLRRVEVSTAFICTTAVSVYSKGALNEPLLNLSLLMHRVQYVSYTSCITRRVVRQRPSKSAKSKRCQRQVQFLGGNASSLWYQAGRVQAGTLDGRSTSLPCAKDITLVGCAPCNLYERRTHMVLCQAEDEWSISPNDFFNQSTCAGSIPVSSKYTYVRHRYTRKRYLTNHS